MAETIKQYISVSDYARFKGCSRQKVYNMIRDGLVSSVQFNRGKMAGRLVEKPAGYDEWIANSDSTFIN